MSSGTVTTPCAATGKPCAARDLILVDAIRPGVVELIRKDYPDLKDEDNISIKLLNKYRLQYVNNVLEEDVGQLSTIEAQVVQSLHDHEMLSATLSHAPEPPPTFGQWLSDRIASFGGSWVFICIFGALLVAWITLNQFLAATAPDPYPYILLNLILSCLAAIQAPVIMMSQNRQEERDRQRAENDYKINLKAELEIRHLHEKMDHLLDHVIHGLLEIQRIQVELLQEQQGRTRR